MDPLVGRVSPPHLLQDFERFARAFPWPGVAPKSIVVKIVKRQPMPHAVFAGVGGAKAIRAAPPASASLRPEFQGSELVERDRWTVARPLVYIATDHFFFEASFGSLHSFQVLVRRILTLAVLSICRTVSMAMESTISSRTRKSRSFGNDQRR